MADQLIGAASVAVLILAYVLLVEAMTAALVLLAHFTVLQWRSLCALLAEPPRPVPPLAAVPVENQGQEQEAPYLIGGSLRRWE